MSNLLSVKEIEICSSCYSQNLYLVHDFGLVPIAGYFPAPGEHLTPRAAMKLLKCSRCSLIQVSPDISDQELFTDYRYISSVGMQDHFNELTNWFMSRFKPNPNSTILEIGCNDGPLLEALQSKGLQPIGIDPATNIVEIARQKGLTVINDFFNLDAIEKYDAINNLEYISHQIRLPILPTFIQ